MNCLQWALSSSMFLLPYKKLYFNDNNNSYNMRSVTVCLAWKTSSQVVCSLKYSSHEIITPVSWGCVWSSLVRRLHLSIFNVVHLEWGTEARSLCGQPLSSECQAHPSRERSQPDRGTASHNLGHSGLWLLVVTSEWSPQYYGTMWASPLYLLFPWTPGQS